MVPIIQNILIRQGADFIGKSLLLSGDYSEWEFKWQIRKRFKGELLAEGEVEVVFDTFVIEENTYENHTLITPVLDHLLSETLPPALGNTIGKTAWVYDVKMKSPDESTVYRIFEGLVNVTQEVTLFYENGGDSGGFTGLSGETLIVANIAARNVLTLKKNTQVLVLDATEDPTVSSGAAIYLYSVSTTSWIKLSEAESMDVVLQWANIQGKPTSTSAAIDTSVTNSHTHANKTLLDEIGLDSLEKTQWTTIHW